MSDFTLSSDDVENDFEEDRPKRLAPTPSHLDRLRSVLSQDIRKDDLIIAVPARPGFSLMIDVNDMTAEILKKYSKACSRNNRAGRRSNSGGELDEVRLASLIIHNHTVGIRVDGEEILDEGKRIDLSHEMIHEMLSISVPEDFTFIVQSLFGLDGHIASAVRAIQEYAGYAMDSDDLDEDEVNPTKRR